MTQELTEMDVAVLKGTRNYGALTTVNADGSLQSSITWVDTADGLVLINTAVGRTQGPEPARQPPCRDPGDRRG